MYTLQINLAASYLGLCRQDTRIIASSISNPDLYSYQVFALFKFHYDTVACFCACVSSVDVSAVRLDHVVWT